MCRVILGYMVTLFPVACDDIRIKIVPQQRKAKKKYQGVRKKNPKKQNKKCRKKNLLNKIMLKKQQKVLCEHFNLVKFDLSSFPFSILIEDFLFVCL